MHKAFLPGAGLGTRLRPVTRHLPKPLVPLFHQPLVIHALDACRAAGIIKFAINTHHLPEVWRQAFPACDPSPWQGENGESAWQARHAACPLAFFHEPILLDTGGGLRNIREWLGHDPVLVHNADIFSTIPLRRFIEAHLASGLPVSLLLRSRGPALHVAVDDSAARVVDIRRRLGRAGGTHQFTGIYCASPELLDRLPPREAASVIPAFLELAGEGRLGAVVIDDGVWLDLGDPATLLAAHLEPPLEPGVARRHPAALVDPAAAIDGASWLGPGAVIGAACDLTECVVFPGVVAPPGKLRRALILPDGLIVQPETSSGAPRDH